MMQTYLNRGAGLLNPALLVFAVVMLQDVTFDELKFILFIVLFIILLIVTPAFTLFALFAPRGQ